MQTITLLNQAIHYIESHLTQPATVAEAAVVAGYSRHHFSRTFLALTGLSPTSYLRKRRLTEAARELITSPKRILDIALDYQFGSQEAFTRSFKQEFGVSPGLYRQRGRLHRLLGKLTLGVSDLLYPGQGIDTLPPLLIPEQTIVAAIVGARMSRRGIYFAPEVTMAAPEQATIRLAHRQDIMALCRLYHEFHEEMVLNVPDRLQSLGDYECFDASALSLSLQTLVDAVDVAIWVAERNGRVVGLAEVYLREDEENTAAVVRRYGYLQSLVVTRPLRGQGIGVQLLDAAEAWSREQGAAEHRLKTWEYAQGPLAFYEHQGYRTLRRTLVRQL